MSELTELLADQNVLSAVYDAFDPVRELLPKHDAEVAAKAREEALEAACKRRCGRCQAGYPVQLSTCGDTDPSLYAYEHFANGYEVRCSASDIRAEFARRWPEEFGD